MVPKKLWKMMQRITLALIVTAVAVLLGRFGLANAHDVETSSLSMTGKGTDVQETVRGNGQFSTKANDDRTIRRVQQVSARELDENLPDVQFIEWITDRLPPQAAIGWALTDCGEQTGDPAVDEGRIFPSCVTMEADFGPERIEISILAGESFESGVDDLHSYLVWYAEGGDVLEVLRLSDIPSFRDAPQEHAAAALYRMRWVRRSLDERRSDANLWWQLQKTAENLGRAISTTCRDGYDDAERTETREKHAGMELIEEARSFGISFHYCESGEAWLVGNEGYRNYLQYWPTGPHADKAYWHTHIEPPCCDECGSFFGDEARRNELVMACRQFMETFPSSWDENRAEFCQSVVGQ